MMDWLISLRSISKASVAGVCLAALACLVLAGCQSSTNEGSASKDVDHAAVSLDAIIAGNTTALGGEEALDGVTTMVKTSRIVQRDSRDLAVFATDRLGRMRVDIFSGGNRVYAESYDGERAYQWNPQDGQSAASERGTIALSHTPQLPNHIFRLKDLVANGHSLEMLENETIDGVEHSVLKLTLSDGFENCLWVDRRSGFVVRTRNERALHVDIDDQERVIESLSADFRAVGDIMHPHRVLETDLRTGEVLVEVTVLSMALNVDLADSYFLDLVREAPEAP